MAKRAPLLLLLLAVAVVAARGGDAPPAFDLVVRNGRVLDGSGAPWRRADVGVRDDRIVAIGRLDHASAREEIDAAGRYVVPGFIDAHSHAYPALSRPGTAAAEALLRQGITTVLINPDGGGPVDLAAQRRTIESVVPGVNVVQLIGHNAVRGAVLGSADRAPDDAELARMAALVRRGFEAGAFGLSAGPFYTPGAFSKTEEHIALARVAAEFDGFYTSHIRDEADYTIGVVAAVEEVIRVAQEARLPGIVTHIKVLGPRVWGLSGEIIKRIDAARAAGVELYADQYPYEASSTGLTAALVPSWALAGGVGKLQGRLANAELRARIRREMIDNLARRAGPANIMIRSFKAEPALEGRRLDAIARERLLEPVDAALDLIQRGGASIVSFNMDERDLRAFMVQPWTMTSSDGELVAFGEGVPHPRSYGPYPRKLRRYVFDEALLPLERAIHSMSGLPAAVFRIRDRGTLRAGAFADLAVFDPAAVRDRATYEQPHQYAEGVTDVVVNGRVALRSGRLLAGRAGRVLIRERP